MAFDSGALVVAADGIWISGDGGARFAASGLSDPAVTALATHPDHPGLICAAQEAGGLTISADGGTTWRGIGGALPNAPVDAVAIAAQDPALLYVAVRDDGLWQSKDGGETWEFAMDRPFQEQAERDVLALASVSSPSGMGGIWVFAGTELGVTKVPDCFCRWQDVQPGDAMDALVSGKPAPSEAPLPEGETINALVSAASQPTRLYAALPSGIWESQDAGVVWSQRLSTSALAVAVHPANADHVVDVTGDGLIESRDGGANWTALARA